MNWSDVDYFPGISVAYKKTENDAIHIESCGYADLAKNVKVTENTVFPACSISKFITAICVMKMKAMGLVKLNVDVNGYLKDWKVRSLNNETVCVTLEDLLSHTAGIIDGEDGFYGHRIGGEHISLIDILEGKTKYNTRSARVEKVPGKSFEYSDAGYCIVQMIIENITDKKYDKVIDEFVFRPLGMKNSFVGTEENLNLHKDRITTGYHRSGDVIEGGIPLCPDMAASAVWTTPSDLLLLAADFYSHLDHYGQEMLVGPKSFPWVGLGLFKDGRNVISQGWGENGQCILKINTETGAMGVVMTNMDPEVSQEESGLNKLIDSMILKR